MLFSVVVGYLFPNPGTLLNNLDLGGICINKELCLFSKVSDISIAFIFILSGLSLSTQEVTKSNINKMITTFGLLSILIFSPCLALWTSTWNFKTEAYTLGLSLGFIQATTLSSGPILASQANGNVALALLLTVSSNFFAIFTMPLLLRLILSNADAVNFNTGNIIINLLVVILFPLIIGKLLRKFIKLKTQKAKNMSKIFSTFCLTLIIWMVVSNSSESFTNIDILSTFWLVLSVIVLHLILIGFNGTVSKYFLKCEAPVERSLIICCSQKTLPVAVTVLEQIGADGVSIVPLLVIQIVQIIIDALLALYWTTYSDNIKTKTKEKVIKEAEIQEIKLPTDENNQQLNLA